MCYKLRCLECLKGYLYHVSNVLSNLDAQNALKDICITDTNKLLFWHLNFNSIRNKFDFSCHQVKGVADILMISETKLDDSFPGGQFLMEGYHAKFTFDRSKVGGGIYMLCGMLYS